MKEHYELIIACLSFLLAFAYTAYYFSARLNKMQNDLLEEYREKFARDEESKTHLLIYALTDIHNRFVREEEYEQAQDVLKEINALKENVKKQDNGKNDYDLGNEEEKITT